MTRILKTLMGASAMSLIAAVAHAGSTEDTRAVIDHHLAAFEAQDLEAMLSDYTDETVIFFPGAKLVGAEQMRPFAEQFFAEFSAEGSHFTIHEMQIDGNLAYYNWTAESPNAVYELGSDTLIVEDGKIVSQTVVMNVVPKQ